MANTKRSQLSAKELQQSKIEQAMKVILNNLGENVTREGLAETPARYARYITKFLEPKPFNFTTFSSEGSKQMVVLDTIPFSSLCEHHLLSFSGYANIAYIPNGRIAGLSKFARAVDLFAGRLQNQERITSQVHEFLSENLATQDVIVMLTAKHSCMEIRGVHKQGVWTTTCAIGGVFMTNPMAKQEFYQIISMKKG